MQKEPLEETFYDGLNDAEIKSALILSRDLKPWETIIRNCVEAGVMVSTLKANNQHLPRLHAAAPFLKRSLTDLRALWMLMQVGYTSPAASIAASLYENALTASVLAMSDELMKEAASSKYAEIPWGAKRLTQLSIKLNLEYQDSEHAQEVYETQWVTAYSHYKWLCQIKHPTWQSTFHDLKSALVGDKEYVIAPFPNVSEEDLHLKYVIIGGAASKVFGALRSYYMALECDESTEKFREFEERMNIIHSGIIEQLKKYVDKSPPVQIRDNSFVPSGFKPPSHSA